MGSCSTWREPRWNTLHVVWRLWDPTFSGLINLHLCSLIPAGGVGLFNYSASQKLPVSFLRAILFILTWCPSLGGEHYMKDRKNGKNSNILNLFFSYYQKQKKKNSPRKTKWSLVGFHIWPVTQALNFAPDWSQEIVPKRKKLSVVINYQYIQTGFILLLKEKNSKYIYFWTMWIFIFEYLVSRDNILNSISKYS